MSGTGEQTDSGVLERSESETQEPPSYRVILHNDDYTTMEFVIEVLESVFALPSEEAFRVMMLVHTRGFGVCGIYSFEIAETKAAMVHDLARGRGFPLRASVEEAP
jgi:ATP-dependent Clp protease adaptor protein ClpS